MKTIQLYKLTLPLLLLSAGMDAAAQSKVGMGTITPATTLDIRGTDSTAAITVGTANGTSGALFLGNNGHGLRRSFPSNVANNNNVGLYTTSGNVYLSSNGATDFSKFVLTNAGNVGIGTGSPIVKLDVTGSIAATGNIATSGNLIATGNLTLGSLAAGTATDQVLTITAAGVVNKRTVAAVAPAIDFYTTNGTLTDTRTVFLDSNRLEFKGINGTYSFRSGGNNFNCTAKELLLEQSGDQYGSTILRLRNRDGENGLKISTNLDAFAPNVTDLVFDNGTGNRYIRSEARLLKKFGSDGIEMQFGVESDPGLVVGSSYIMVRANALTMNSTVSGTAGANPKLVLVPGATSYGFGVSNNQLDYMTPASAKHAFYEGGVLKLSINQDNSITTASGASLTSGGAWTNASDVRLKKDIAGIGYGLEEVMKLHPVFYHMKANNEAQVGFIAQELRKVIPEVVVGKEGDLAKGEILSVSYGNLAAVLTKAIQEQQAQITRQAAAMAVLQQENKTLKAQAAQVANLATEMADLRSDISRLVLNKIAKGKTARK